jgi:hypothetical protein
VPRVAKMANEPPGGLKATAGACETTPAGESGVEYAAVDTEPGRRVEVPKVSGRSLEEAVRIISDAGFEVAAIEGQGGQHSAIGTEPQAGSQAKPGTSVILTMGGRPAGVPSDTSASASAGYANRG